MRQLRHQNHHLKQQLEQQRDITVKLQDSMEVLAFQMNKMGTVNRGQLGCTMALLQQTAQGSKLGGGSTAQYVQASDTSNDEKLTAAARQRRKAEKRSHELLMAAKQEELRLQDRQMQATHPGPPSSPASCCVPLQMHSAAMGSAWPVLHCMLCCCGICDFSL